MQRQRKGLAAFLLVLGVVLPLAAQAQERKSPLADAPAIRRRVELRDRRFELGAGLSSTVGQDFYNAVLLNLRAGFHISDWLAISGGLGFNLTPKFKTSFHDQLTSYLPGKNDPTPTDRTPTLAEAEASMNRIGMVVLAQAELIPFTGKYSLFNKLFMNYDFYLFGGPGFVNFKADQAACTAKDNPSCPVTGWKVGANFGIGFHSYINDFMAINAEIRNILLRNNDSGRDSTGDMLVDNNDLSWDANYFFGINVMFFFPSQAAKSN